MLRLAHTALLENSPQKCQRQTWPKMDQIRQKWSQTNRKGLKQKFVRFYDNLMISPQEIDKFHLWVWIASGFGITVQELCIGTPILHFQTLS